MKSLERNPYPKRSKPVKRADRTILGFKCANCGHEWHHDQDKQCPNCRTIFTCIALEVLG